MSCRFSSAVVHTTIDIKYQMLMHHAKVYRPRGVELRAKLDGA
jgi:hypothetical protein